MGGCPLHTRHCNLLTPKKKEGVGVGDEGGTLCPMNHYTLMNLRLIQLNHPTPPTVSWLTQSTLILLPIFFFLPAVRVEWGEVQGRRVEQSSNDSPSSTLHKSCLRKVSFLRLKAYLTTSKERREEEGRGGGRRKGRREGGGREGRREGGREIYCKTLMSLKHVHPMVCNYELN